MASRADTHDVGECGARKKKRKKNMKVNVTYRLNQDGQRAALIAGRPASATVTEDLECPQDLIGRCAVTSAGELTFDASGADYRVAQGGCLYLSSSPATVADIIAQYDAWLTGETAEREKEKVERQAIEDAKNAKIRALQAEHAPLVASILDELEADPSIKIKSSDFCYGTVRHPDTGEALYVTPDAVERCKRIWAARESVRVAAEQAAENEKQAARERMLAEHGGYLFPVEAGMCSFRGQDLWSSGQSKRWVGVFSAPKGIDEFLSSPRGEFTWVVSGLRSGQCIQGGGYDMNSRGKRRNESEFFGVVVSNNESGIVIAVHGSRAAALKASAKLTSKVVA